MSRLKSARGASKPAKPAKAAKPGKSSAGRPAARQVMVPKAKNDVYTAMLGVSLGAILIGATLLALVLNRYDFKTKVSLNTSNEPALTALA